MPSFSESVEVRVLNLDVDVTDSKGIPITDLKREDFTLKIGGKPVPIDYFSTVSDGTIHAPDLSSAPPEQVLDIYRRAREPTFRATSWSTWTSATWRPACATTA